MNWEKNVNTSQILVKKHALTFAKVSLSDFHSFDVHGCFFTVFIRRGSRIFYSLSFILEEPSFDPCYPIRAEDSEEY